MMIDENPMTTRDLITRIYEHVLAGAFDDLPPLLTDDFHIVESDGLPYAGTYLGVAGMQALMAHIGAVWGDSSGAIEAIISDGDRAAAVLKLYGQRRDGSPAAVPICEVWDVRDGKAWRCRPFYWDTGYVAKLAAEAVA